MNVDNVDQEVLDLQAFALKFNGFLRRRKWALILALIIPALVVCALLIRDHLRYRSASFEKLSKFWYEEGNLKSESFQRIEYETLIDSFARDEELFTEFVSFREKKGVFFETIKKRIKFVPQFLIQTDAARNRREYLNGLFVLSTLGDKDQFGLVLDYLRNLFIMFSSYPLIKSEKAKLYDEIARYQNSRRNIFLNVKSIEFKIAEFKKKEKDLDFRPVQNYQILIQAGSENERYLDYQAQLTANSIMLIDFQRELQRIERQIEINLLLHDLLERIESNFYQKFSTPFIKVLTFLEEKISQIEFFEGKEAIRALYNRLSIYKETYWSCETDPKDVPRPQSFYLKLFLLYCFLVCLLLLAVIVFDQRKRRVV